METTQSKYKDPGMMRFISQDYPNSKQTLLNELTFSEILRLNLLTPVSMHILHTVLYTFPNMLRRRICSTINGDQFLHFHDH